ncbi:uncharacterized protein [Asterias amurensis]|uniref:uncharacterized protein n=1 Tax=Asterias amurensis TaxID=7602 RepID=UPI003AB2DD10
MARRIPVGGNGCFILVAASVVLALIVRIDAVDCPNIDNKILATDPDQNTALFVFVQPENYTCAPPPGNRFPVGQTTVVCTSVDDGTTCTFQVQVNDEQPPTMTCPLSSSAYTNSGVATGTATWSYSVTDNVLVVTQSCSAISGVQFPIGVTHVTCTAADAAGNTDRCQFPVSIVDNEDPVITSCPEDITSTIELINSQLPPLTSVITWDIPAANDNSGGPVGLTSTHEQGSEFSIGVTSVIYTAADEYGNSETCEFQVKVIVHPPNNDLKIKNVPTSGVCLSVSWPESTDETLDDYSLYAYRHGEVRPDSSQRIVVPSGTSTYINHNVCRLQPGELYTIEVDGDQLSSAMHWTKPNTPGEVSLLPGTLGPSSFTFTWQRSTQNVEQYYWSYNGQSGYVSNTTDSVSIESVYPYTTGFVFVSAVVGSGQQRVQSGSATQQVTTAALRPLELLAYNYTESTIKLAWVSSSDTRGMLDPYMLFIEPRDAEENYLETVNSFVEFKGLKSNTEYQIQLISNLGLMLETSQKTRPGRVANLRPTEVLENSITLAWDRPVEGAVKSYYIWISPGEKPEPFNEGGTSRTFNKLTNNTEYFFRVVSIYNDMRSVPQDLMVTTGVSEPKNPHSVDITAIVLGVVLGLLVIILTVVLISTYLKYRKVIKDELPRVHQPRQTPYNQPDIQTSSVTQVDSDQSYEPLAVNKPAPKQAQGSHYQNTAITGTHQGPLTKKKIPPIPMLPRKSKQQPAENGVYAIPDIHG